MGIRQEMLTETQKMCLRLVAIGRTSKEIAIETGLSPQTIDQYLSRATQTLGAMNRRDAARRLIALENAPFNKSEFKPDAVANPDLLLPQGGAKEVQALSAAHDAMHDLTAPYWPEKVRRQRRWRSLFPPLGGPRNDLTSILRLKTILYLALFVAIATLALVSITVWTMALLA